MSEKPKLEREREKENKRESEREKKRKKECFAGPARLRRRKPDTVK